MTSNKHDRGNLTMLEIYMYAEKKSHTILIINVSKTLQLNVLSKNEHFIHIHVSFFSLSNEVLKWIYYFVIIVTPF